MQQVPMRFFFQVLPHCVTGSCMCASLDTLILTTSVLIYSFYPHKLHFLPPISFLSPTSSVIIIPTITLYLEWLSSLILSEILKIEKIKTASKDGWKSEWLKRCRMGESGNKLKTEKNIYKSFLFCFFT